MIEIRRATLEDLDALLPMVASYRSFYGQTPDAARERELIAAHLRDARSTVFWARDEHGMPIGFVQLFLTYSTVRLGPSLILEDLFVIETARRAGVATKLLHRAFEHAREIEAVGMFLETAFDNAAAQRAYERAGWSREAQFYKYNAPM
jgi:GNAT superfamily N-acetyltransferase